MLPAMNKNNEFVGFFHVSQNSGDKTLRFATHVAPTEDDDFRPSVQPKVRYNIQYVDIPLDVITRFASDNVMYFMNEEHAKQSLENRIINHLPSEIREYIESNNIRIKFDKDFRSDKILVAKLCIKVARLTDDLLENIFDTPFYQPI